MTVTLTLIQIFVAKNWPTARLLIQRGAYLTDAVPAHHRAHRRNQVRVRVGASVRIRVRVRVRGRVSAS